MALDLPLPKHIFAHGWITIDETKMSKSLGNVVSPTSVLENFNMEYPDAFRYYMATSAPSEKTEIIQMMISKKKLMLI